MIGDQLEELGWRQGSLLKNQDYGILDDLVIGIPKDNLIVIVASQSCDIANNNLDHDPYIEFSLGTLIDKGDGNLTHNKNPRILHIQIDYSTDTIEVVGQLFVEILAYKKAFIPKEHLMGLNPDSGKTISNDQLKSYVSWLSARYSRPALPTEFNNRIAKADPKNKRKRKAKTLNSALSGLYIEIIPDAEIPEDQNYNVNLLALLSPGFDSSDQNIKSAIGEYADILLKSGMDVSIAIRNESEVSISTIKRFKRFYYDDLSLKEGTELPLEP